MHAKSLPVKKKVKLHAKSYFSKLFREEKVSASISGDFFSPEKVIEMEVNSKKKMKLALRSFAFRKKGRIGIPRIFRCRTSRKRLRRRSWRPILFRHEKLPGDRFFFAGKSYWLRKTQADIFSARKVIGGAKDGGRFSPRKVIGCAVDGGLLSSAERII